WRREVLADLGRAAAVYLAPGQPFDAADGVRCEPLPSDPTQAAARLLADAARLAARPRAPAATPARPRLAYVSPLPPAASGIADYSAELLPALAEHYDIELVPTGPTPPAASFTAPYPVREPAWFLEHAGRYDRVVYQFGNSPFHREMVGLLRLVPGTAVVHDFYLGHLYAHVQHSGHAPMALRRAVLRSHGPAALRCLRDEGEGAVLARYPCNFEIFGQGDGVIVHSQHARELARRWYGDALP